MKKTIIISTSVLLTIFFTLSIINKSINIHKYINDKNIGYFIKLDGENAMCKFIFSDYIKKKNYDEYFNECSKETVEIKEYIDIDFFILTKCNMYTFYQKDYTEYLINLRKIYQNSTFLNELFINNNYVYIRPFKDLDKVIVDDDYYYNIKDNEYSKILEGVNLYKGVKYNNLYDVYIYSDENLDSTVINSNGETVFKYTYLDRKIYYNLIELFPKIFE